MIAALAPVCGHICCDVVQLCECNGNSDCDSATTTTARITGELMSVNGDDMRDNNDGGDVDDDGVGGV